MEQSRSWEANRLLSSQEILRILWNPNSHVPANCPYPDSARSSPYTHIPLPENTSYYYSSIYAWVSHAVSIPQVSTPNPVYAFLLPHKLYIHRPSKSTRFYYPNNIVEAYWSLCSLVHSLVTSSLLSLNILLITLFSKTLSLRSSLNVIDQVLHP